MTLLDEDPALSRDDLADRAGADPDALSHAFKRELGVGLVAYRNRLRVRRFLELASTGRLTLLAACLRRRVRQLPAISPRVRGGDRPDAPRLPRRSPSPRALAGSPLTRRDHGAGAICRRQVAA